MNVRAEFNFGKLSKNQWSSVFGYRPEDTRELEVLGEMYAVIRMGIDTEEFEIEKFAKLLLEELQQAYFNAPQVKESKLEQLEDASWKMKSRMEVILSREEEIQKSGVDIEMAIAVIIEDALYAIVIGESRIIVSRQGNIVDITEALVDLKMSGLIKSGSLQLEKSDRIGLVTSQTHKLFESEFDQLISNLDVSLLKHKEQPAGGAVMLLADEHQQWKEEKEIIAEELVNEKIKINSDESLPLEDEIILETEEAHESELEEIELQNEEMEELEDEEEKEGIWRRLKVSIVNFKTKISDRFSKDKKAEMEIDPEEIKDGEEELPKVSKKINLANLSSMAVKVKDIGKSSTKRVRNHFEENQTTYVQIIRNIRGNFTRVVRKSIDFIKAEVIGVGSARRLDHRKRLKRNRWIFAISTVVIAVLLISIINDGRNRAAQNERKRNNEETVQTLNTRFQELEIRAAENIQSDPVRKAQVIQELTTLQKSIKDNKTNTDIVIQLETLDNQVIQTLDELQLAESFTQPSLVTNILTKFPEANLRDMIFAEDFIFVADSARNAIYRVRPTLGTEAEEFIVEGLTAPKLMAPNYQGEIVFYDDNTTSVLGKFRIADGSITRLAGLVATEVGKIDALSIYQENGAIYEIHKNNRQIFKRDANSNSFVGGGALPAVSPPTNWKTSQAFADAIDIKVQYFVYVLIEGLGIERYLAGGDNTLTQAIYTNLLPEDYNALKNATAFEVISPYMVVGDSVNKRIMVFQIQDDEQGSVRFLKQYIYRGSENVLNDITQIAINTISGHIYVLDNGKILRFDLPRI